jgi:hypothetical protein
LQIAGTTAAAGYLGGGAISFGWPRPILKTFSDALTHAVNSCIREGEVRDRPRAGSAKTVKDAGIDVIAWAHSPDLMPGRLILLGQCATGKEWIDKGARNYFRAFQDDFFNEWFPSEAIPAIFVPFCLGASKTIVAHAVVFCVDEKTAIQALDRLDPVLPLSPGRAERHGFEYYRHGTLSLYAALNTKTGIVQGKTVSRHTSAEFIALPNGTRCWPATQQRDPRNP